MKHIIYTELETLVDLTTDLANSLAEEYYTHKLGRLPSNTFGQQLECVISTRESYLQTLQGLAGPAGTSIKDSANKLEIMRTLFRSSAELLVWLDTHEPNEVEIRALFKLIEHEAQHHGQLIRYVYGNKWTFPSSWLSKYSL